MCHWKDIMDYRDLNDERTNFAERQHAAAREQFPAYAAAVARGVMPPDTELSAHLATCASCRAELDELIAVVTAAYGGQIATAPAYPAADLSLLTHAGK